MNATKLQQVNSMIGKLLHVSRSSREVKFRRERFFADIIPKLVEVFGKIREQIWVSLHLRADRSLGRVNMQTGRMEPGCCALHFLKWSFESYLHPAKVLINVCLLDVNLNIEVPTQAPNPRF